MKNSPPGFSNREHICAHTDVLNRSRARVRETKHTVLCYPTQDHGAHYVRLSAAYGVGRSAHLAHLQRERGEVAAGGGAQAIASGSCALALAGGVPSLAGGAQALATGGSTPTVAGGAPEASTYVGGRGRRARRCGRRHSAGGCGRRRVRRWSRQTARRW
jgi:hypothetical protein